jgi:hypothetical protein
VGERVARKEVAMWLITTRGFVSAVRSRDGKQIVLRARVKKDLECLRDVMPGMTEIAIYPNADYRYRAWVDVDEYADGVAKLAREVTYRNFKTEAALRGWSGRSWVLHDIWDVLGDMQPTGPYGWREKAAPVPADEKELQEAYEKDREKERKKARRQERLAGWRDWFPLRPRPKVKPRKAPETRWPDDADEWTPEDQEYRDLAFGYHDEIPSDDNGICCECGVKVDVDTGVFFGGEWFCRDEQACVERVLGAEGKQKVSL